MLGYERVLYFRVLVIRSNKNVFKCKLKRLVDAVAGKFATFSWSVRQEIKLNEPTDKETVKKGKENGISWDRRMNWKIKKMGRQKMGQRKINLKSAISERRLK